MSLKSYFLIKCFLELLFPGNKNIKMKRKKYYQKFIYNLENIIILKVFFFK